MAHRPAKRKVKAKPVIKKVRLIKVEKVGANEHLIAAEYLVHGAPDPPVPLTQPVEIGTEKEMSAEHFSIWKWLRSTW